MTTAAINLTVLTKVIGEIRCAIDHAHANRRDRLVRISGDIRKAALKTFHEVERPRFQRLRDAIAGGGLPLATLSVCGHGTQEIRFTQLFRYFLDPKAAHGLGPRILQATMDAAGCPRDKISADAVAVQAEVSLGTIRAGEHEISSILDLLIRSADFFVLIEQKIHSAEGGQAGGETSQLKRYDKAIALNHPEIRENNSWRVFLTPTRRDPREGVAWRPVAHEDIFRHCAAVLKDPTLSRVARHNLCSFLWDLMMGPMGVDEEVLGELREHVDGALRDETMSLVLKRWLESQGIKWPLVLNIMEACYE